MYEYVAKIMCLLAVFVFRVVKSVRLVRLVWIIVYSHIAFILAILVLDCNLFFFQFLILPIFFNWLYKEHQRHAYDSSDKQNLHYK